ncbi:MAG: hypothetical protein LBQ67_04765 [Treponema sp.]|jgi:hypothetical protein|nr:hypothetical protein [Treponema sp.]
MGPVKPAPGEAALPPLKPAAAKGAASPGPKPLLTGPAGDVPVPPKANVFHAPSFGSSLFSPGLKVQELYKQSAALLGLPQDTLSFTLISAIRYFSLSPDTALLSRLRGELLASGAASAPKNSRDKAALEAKALAAAAAADKGLRLSPEALEEYAAAMEPGAWFSGGGGRQGQPEDGKPSREATPDGEELEELCLKGIRKKDGEEGLLAWLNRLPGRDGQGWAVFPFKIKVGGIELKVSVRLLIKKHPLFVPGESGGQGRLIVDIQGAARGWRFILDRSGGGKSVLDITVYPGQERDIKALEKEAEKFFGGPGTEIRVRKSDEAPFLADQRYQEVLLSVNEEV